MKQKDNRATRLSAIVIAIAVILVVTVGSVFAAYLKYSKDVLNNFESADSVTPTIHESFEDKTVKKDVSFNVGPTEYPVYVRVAIVITWQNEQGIVYFKPVEEDDYEIALNLDDWTLRDDGYYYYNTPVESNGETSELIRLCRQLNPAPVDGYTLSVDIIVQTIQAVGYTDGEDNTDPDNDTGKIPAWDDAGWDVLEQTSEPETEPETEPESQP